MAEEIQSNQKPVNKPLDITTNVLDGSWAKQDEINANNKREAINRAKAAYETSAIELKKEVSPAFLEGQNKARNLRATYDNPHHPTTEKFNEYSKGWIAETNSQNEKKLATSTNVNLPIEKRQKAFDFLQSRSSHDNTSGKPYFTTNEGKVGLGKKPQLESTVNSKEKADPVKVVETKEVINSIESTLTKEELFEKKNKIWAKDFSDNENQSSVITPEEIKKNLGIKGISKEAQQYKEERERVNAEWDNRVSVQAREQSQPQLNTKDGIEKDQLFDPAKDRLKNSIPDEVRAKYTQVENKFYFKGSTEKLAFNDKGQKLETKLDSNKGVTESLVAIAKNRGWSEIKVNGSEAFRKDVWQKASEQGIAVKGYTPTKKEMAELEQKGIELPKKGQSLPPKKEVLTENQKAAKDFKEMSHEEVVKKHPKLAPYVAAVVAIEKKMDTDKLTDHEKNIVMKRVQQNTVNSIEKGIVPKVAIQSKQETRKHTAEQEVSR